jgi:hypothetical protein
MNVCRCGQTFAAGVKHYCQLVDEVNLRLSQELFRSSQEILHSGGPESKSPSKAKSKAHEFPAMEGPSEQGNGTIRDDDLLRDDEVHP